MKTASEQITISVSERVLRQASRIASRRKQQVEDVLSAWLENLINELPINELPDEDILALSELQLSKKQETRLSELLTRNREGILDSSEQKELDDLMRLYEHGLLRRSQALRVAVQRGLRPPLQS
mgnify:CR=1 FL=1